MSLYPKKIRNIEELKQEHLQLKKQLAELNDTDLFSVSNILGISKKTEGKQKGKNTETNEQQGANPISFLMDMLPMVYPLIDMGIGMLQSKKNKPEAAPKKKAASEHSAETKPSKNILKSVAFEILTGYLKWKAIELSYKGVKHIIKKKKENKAMRELEEEMG